MIKWICSFVFLIVFFANSTAVYSKPEIPENIVKGDYSLLAPFSDQLAAYWLDEDDLAGLTIGIIDGEKVTWSRSYGFADVENKRPANDETLYRIGALSGIFTVLLVLKLEEQGLLKLDDDVRKYVPGLFLKFHDSNDHIISIRQILSHHAGFPLSRFKGSWEAVKPDFHAVVSQMNDTYMSYVPDKIYAYSNTGYSLLAVAVENITKLTFEKALKKFVLDPLGLANTHLELDSDSEKKLARGYKESELKPLLFPRDIASLGIYSSTSDMLKLIKGMLQKDGSFFTDNIKKMMFEAQNSHVKLDLEKQLGLGWYIGGMGLDDNYPIIWRSGATLNYRARIAVMPALNIGVIVLVNDAMGWKASESMAESLIKILVAIKTGTRNENHEKAPVEIKKYDHRAFANSYNSFGGFITVQPIEEGYSSRLLGFSLVSHPKQNGWYNLEYDLLGFIPIDITWIADVYVRPDVIDSYPILVSWYKGKEYLFGTHFPLSTPHNSWKKRLGTYRVINHDKLLERMEVKRGQLKLIDGNLFFLYEIPMFLGLELKIPVRTLSETHAIIEGLGTGLNESIIVRQFGNKEYLEYSGYLLEKVKTEESIFNF